MLASFFAVGLTALSAGVADECATAPTFPAVPPAVTELAPEPSYETARHIAGYDRALLGVGHLQPEGPDHYDDWHQHVSIPLYRGSPREHVGWIHGGWVEIGSSRKAFTYAGTTETDYERASLIILEADEDDWILLRYDQPRDTDEGTAWTHRCALSLGTMSLSVQLWSDVYSSEGAPALHFRTRVRHSLRAEPSVASERVAWIGENAEVESLEIRGEWMRVNAYDPGKFYWGCTAGSPWAGAEYTGWIRWWDEAKGPWLYWSTRGC
jgi:hypothetical protein